MEDILTALWAQSATQWIALITGLAYVILATFEKPLCWPFGIVSCTVIAVEDFSMLQLYADGVLQIFYVIMGFAGLYFWLFRNAPGTSLRVSSMPLMHHVAAIAIAAAVSVPLAYLLGRFTDAAFSYLDTLTTLLSLWATWLLVRKVLENWLFWIAIDVVYVYLYAMRGGDLIAVLYAVYLLVAVWGFFRWRKSKSAQ